MVRWMLALIVLEWVVVSGEAVHGAVASALGGSAETAAPLGLPTADETEQNESSTESEADKKESDDGEEADEAGATDAKDVEGNDAETSGEPTAAEKAPEDEKKDEPLAEDAKKDDAESAKSADAKQEDAPSEPGEKPSGEEKPAAEKKSEEKEKKPELVKVKTKDLKIEVEAEGVFVAAEAEEAPLRPEVWSTFKVLEAVPHGKRVRKGDVLVRFDDKEFEEALAEKSLQQRLGELTLLAAEEEFPRLEKSVALNYDDAKRTYEQAQDEYARFQETMREMSEKLAEYYLKSAEQDFESAQEELDQLVKMYEADELTEETEEIVLRRQKFQVEAAKFFVDYSKINHEYTMTVSIPRRDEMLKTAVETAKIEYERAKMAKSLGLNQQRYELQSLREARRGAWRITLSSKRTAPLMTLKSPADGIAYYGRQVNGRWIEVGAMEQKLMPFGTVSPNSVVMTIVKDRPLYVETSIGEKELPTVKAEQAAVVVPAADGELELKGVVEKLADVPGSGNKFVVRVELKAEKTPDWLMPGMTGKTKITTYDVKDAVVIAAELVQTDEDDPKKKYVMIQAEGEEKPVRRDVKLGKTKDKEVEVLKGLKKGDQIVKGAKDEAAQEE